MTVVSISAERPPVDLPPTDLRQFGRYTLLYRFAAGGMANLYLAKLAGADGFEKLVAVKVIHGHLTSDPQFVDMFINEARLSSRISHPNVAQIIELGRYEGVHFIAMEYVAGESVAELVRRSRLAPTYCARIVADAAAGLHAAHELHGEDGESLQVVHRDVSPQNILISYGGAVKVVDFGVARTRGSLVTTRAGEVKGKFSYMAPEQLKRGAAVDRRADVFALGIILYEMTTGRRLFKGDTEDEVICQVKDCVVDSPSGVESRYPEQLENIVMRALARDPADRFQTARELQEALERYIHECGDPVLQVQIGELMSRTFATQQRDKEEVLRSCELAQEAASGVSSSDEEGPPRRRRWAPLVVGGALALAFVTLVVLTVLPRPAPRAASPSPGGQSVAARDSAPTPTPVLPPQEVLIRISARPISARVTFEGKPVENPFELRTPPERSEAVATISAPGHVTRTIAVSLQRGGQWEVVLERKARRGRARKPRRPAGSRTAGAPKTPRPRRGRSGVAVDDVLANPYGGK